MLRDARFFFVTTVVVHPARQTKTASGLMGAEAV